MDRNLIAGYMGFNFFMLYHSTNLLPKLLRKMVSDAISLKEYIAVNLCRSFYLHYGRRIPKDFLTLKGFILKIGFCVSPYNLLDLSDELVDQVRQFASGLSNYTVKLALCYTLVWYLA